VKFIVVGQSLLFLFKFLFAIVFFNVFTLIQEHHVILKLDHFIISLGIKYLLRQVRVKVVLTLRIFVEQRFRSLFNYMLPVNRIGNS